MIIKGGLLIVCLAILVLWVRSYWRLDVFSHLTRSDRDGDAVFDQWSMRSERGWVWVWWVHTSVVARAVAERQTNLTDPVDFPPGWRSWSKAANPIIVEAYASDAGWGPVRWHVSRRPSRLWPTEHRWLRTPHWFAALLFGAWPVVSIALALRRRRRLRIASRRGLCRHCGYDLRATPDGAGELMARCPECGRETTEPD